MVLFGVFFKPQLTFGSLEAREGLEHSGAAAMVPEHGSALAGGCGVCFCVGGDLGPWRERGAAVPTHALVQPHLPLFSPSPSSSCCRGKVPLSAQAPRLLGAKIPPPYPGMCQVRAGRTQLSTHKRGAAAAAASKLPQNASHPPPRKEPAWCSAVVTGPCPTRGCLCHPCPSDWGSVGGGVSLIPPAGG